MAEHTSTQSEKRRQRSVARAERLANERWAGGLSALLNDYRNDRATLKDIWRTCGVDFRAACRLLDAHAVPLRNPRHAILVARKLNPEWAERISRTKLLKPFYHQPEVTERAREKRLKTIAADPSRHGNAHVGMTSREREFADLIEKHGFSYNFNHPVLNYWLDFYVPDIHIGFEVQHASRVPCLDRTNTIRHTLGLTCLIYVPNYYFFTGNIGYMDALLWTLKRDPESIGPHIGDACWLCIKQSDVDVRWYGFGFKRRWASSPIASEQTGSLGQTPDQDRSLEDRSE